jgi:CubicO group peptidase (beta-lactamase class C family)
MRFAEAEKLGFSPKRLTRIGAAMQRYVEEGKLAGMVTLVARRGAVVHFEKFGLQDIRAGVPMELDTIFRIYSMTKPITCVALMMLYEQGLFHLNDPVTRFLPEFEKVEVLTDGGTLEDVHRMITIHDLLTHMAGLSYGDYQDTRAPIDKLYEQANLFDSQISLQEMVRRIAELPLAHQPGQGWRYSVATDVVGRLVEVISGVSLAEFMDREIFGPLRMEDTAYSIAPEKASRFATLYGKTETGNLEELDAAIGGRYSEVKLYLGGSGLVSTASDYLRFAQLLLNGGELDGIRLLGRKTVELMTINHVPAGLLPLVMGEPWPGFGYGLGFGVLMDLAQSGIMGSVGNFRWSGWANTHFWVDPHEQLIGILMLQYIPGGTYPVTDDFKTLVYQALVD